MSYNDWKPNQPVGAGRSAGHPEHAFRARRSDPSRCRVSALSSPGSPDERAGSLTAGSTRKQFDPRVHPPRSTRGAEPVGDKMIRLDRAAPVIPQTMRTARATPQVSDPDEFSAPTRQRQLFGTAVAGH